MIKFAKVHGSGPSHFIPRLKVTYFFKERERENFFFLQKKICCPYTGNLMKVNEEHLPKATLGEVRLTVCHGKRRFAINI